VSSPEDVTMKRIELTILMVLAVSAILVAA